MSKTATHAESQTNITGRSTTRRQITATSALGLLRAVATRTDRPAARLLDVRGRCRVPTPRRFQRRRRRLPTRLVQRDAVVLSLMRTADDRR